MPNKNVEVKTYRWWRLNFLSVRPEEKLKFWLLSLILIFAILRILWFRIQRISDMKILFDFLGHSSSILYLPKFRQHWRRINLSSWNEIILSVPSTSDHETKLRNSSVWFHRFLVYFFRILKIDTDPGKVINFRLFTFSFLLTVSSWTHQKWSRKKSSTAISHFFVCWLLP